MLYVEQRFVQLLAPRLHQFKQKSSNLWNFKCPYCEADSTHRKARGYIYEREGRLLYWCHVCSVSKSLTRFIRDVDPALHIELVREKLLETTRGEPIALPRAEVPTRVAARQWDGLVPLRALPLSHTARAWARSRKLSDEAQDLFYADDFFAWARAIEPEKHKRVPAEPRVVIPFRGADGQPVGFQGRALGDSPAKYVTIVTRPDEPFLFNLDRVRRDDVVIALEGPIDAMFLDNAVASGGGDVTRELARSGLDQSLVVVAYDNERRSPATIKKMRQAIERGYSVCVWPESVRHKDVNDMVVAGMSPTLIRQIVLQSSCRGGAALARLASWSLCTKRVRC